MLNRTLRRRFALSLSALLWTSFAPALPLAIAQQTPPPAPSPTPADKAATDELDSLNKTGMAAYGAGDYSAALKSFQSGLDRAQSLKNEKYTARFLNGIGIVYSALGQNERALDYRQKALTLREKIGEPGGIAASLSSVGNVYSDLGQHEKSLDYQQRGLLLREKMGDSSAIAASLNNIGNGYYYLGQYEKALDYHLRTLTLYEKAGTPQDVARSLSNIGEVYRNLNQYEKALDYQRRALTLQEKAGDPSAINTTLSNIGVVYYQQGETAKALDYYQQALAIQERLGNPTALAESLNNIGGVYSDLGQYEKALDYFHRALRLAEKIDNPADIADSLNNLGSVYAARKRWDEAGAAYAQAQRAFETMSRQVVDPTQFADLQRTMPHLYEQYSNVLAQQKRPDAALALLEAGRVRGIARQLFLNRSGFSKALTSEESANLKLCFSEMNAANKSLGTAEAKLADSSAAQHAFFQKNRDDYANKAHDAERKYDACNAELFKRYPQFRSESGEVTVTPKDLRSLADNKPDTLYLTWAMFDDKRTDLYALSHKDGMTAYPLPVGEKELTAKVGDWLFALTNGLRESDAPPSAAERKQAKALYAALLGPLEKAGLLAKGRYKRLVLVPSGPLLELPFAALMDSSGRRLIENYAVSSKVALSTSFWRANPVAAKSPMLCIADPIGTAPTKEEQVALRRAGFGPLPGARREGLAVAGLFHTAALVGPQAKKADVLRAMPGVKLLHFATHGYLNAKSPFYSGLVLAPEPAGSSDDGVLSAREILNLPLSAKMAVLSACETGRGVAKGGDGLQGLVWAFQAAGCPCVVASQWQVDDEATRALMLAFYRNLQKAGTRKDDAMRSAMLAVKKEKPSPFFWAAFEVIGDTGAL